MSEHIESFQGEHRWLSNFWPARVRFEGVSYPTIEHAYQAAKTDPAWRDPFQGGSPAQAKQHGRRVPVRPGWDEQRLQVMQELIEQKFAPGTELGKRLLDTGEVQIVEGNVWGDTFWGQCRGHGENHLGKLLMQRRSQLREAHTQNEAPTSVVAPQTKAAPRPRFSF